MLRKIALLAGTAALLYGCGAQADPPAGPASSPSPVPASPATVQVSPTVAVDFPADEPPPDLTISTADACLNTDRIYQTLDAETREHITRGVRAEAAGDTKAVRQALKALQPVFASASGNFMDSASKVKDPELKAALTKLSEIATKEATFTSFAQFQSLAALVAPAEATLKSECAAAGHPLANVT